MNKDKLINLDNAFVDRSLPKISISLVNNLIAPPFDSVGVAKKCEEKGKKIDCKWTGKTAEEIIQMWEDKAATSRNYGKLLDSYTEAVLEGNEDDIELWKLNNDIDNDDRLHNHITAFDEFYDRIMKSGDVEYIGREIELYNKVNNFYVNGRMDALFYNNRLNKWIVIDWKSNEFIKTQGDKWSEHLLGPAKDKLHIDWNLYTFQIYNYKEALLQNYLPEGTKEDDVTCMIVNLPQAIYSNPDAILGQFKTYKAYRPAFEYDEDYLNKVYEFAYKKNELIKRKKK